MGYGSGPYGSTPFGAGIVLFDLLSATAVNARAVDLVFEVPLLQDALLLAATSYSFDGAVVCTGVVVTSPTSLRLYTTEQAYGVLYTVTVDPGIGGDDFEVLSANTAQFLGLSSTTAYSVSDLSVRTHCSGRRIDLEWANPTDPVATYSKVVRRQRNWVFDLTDAHDVVYAGAALESFHDTGIVAPFSLLGADIAAGDLTFETADPVVYAIGDSIRVDQLVGEAVYEIKEVTGVSGTTVTVAEAFVYSYTAAGAQVGINSPLRAQAFYYYTVLVSDLAAPSDDSYDFTDNNHGAALSISEMDSKEDFFWKNTPEVMRELDADTSSAGGDGYLDAQYSISGCWLNLLRGYAKAVKLMADNDEAPYNSLSAKNLSLGIEPEGFSYDYEIPRRTLTALANVYKRRGSCEGLVRAVTMFTKWDSLCAEFSLGGCSSGNTTLSTWDGVSLQDAGEGDSTSITVVNRSLTDDLQTHVEDQWKYGIVVGSIGDVACVESSASDELVLVAAEEVSTLSAGVASGSTVIPLTSTLGLYEGMRVQLESAGSYLDAEIAEVVAVSAGVSITLAEPTLNAYALGDLVSLRKSVLRTEYLCSGGTWATVSGTTRELTYAHDLWTENQWAGYALLASDNSLHTVTENAGNTLRVEAASLPADGDFSIATGFTVGGSFAARDPVLAYTVYSGTHSFLLEPTLDWELRGTRFDPFSVFWMGPGATILGAWGPGDVGIYITSPVAQHLGRATSATANVLDVDPSVVPPGVNELAGSFLNPNQNQTQLFRVIANSATTITVAEDISSLVVPGQAYFVLGPRDANRYRQLNVRLGPPSREFAHADISVRILFA